MTAVLSPRRASVAAWPSRGGGHGVPTRFPDHRPIVMRPWIIVAPTLLLAAVSTGCTDTSSLLTGSDSGPVSYACVLADAYSPAVADPSAPSALRDRSVMLRREGRQLMLELRAGDTEYLDPVAGGNGRLFANRQYGWRIADSRSVLTDVQNVRTYNCDRAGSRSLSAPT